MPELTMTLTRALQYCKSTTKKLDAMVDDRSFLLVATSQGLGTKKRAYMHNRSVEETEKIIRANWEQANDLFSNLHTVKAALLVANASTLVKIGSQEMTITQAIDLKTTMGLMLKFARNLQMQIAGTNSSMQALGEHLQANINKRIEASFGIGADKKALSAEVLAGITKDLEDSLTPGRIDPLDLSEKYGKMVLDLEEFFDNVDYALSEVNAKTEITVNLK